MKRSMSLLAVVAALALGACGQTRGDHALTGAGIGAGAGLLGTALFGSRDADPMSGALLGAGAGAVGGLLMPKGKSMGRVPWRKKNRDNEDFDD
jgi:osmotically inducible lipoprotein OsmB